MVHGPPIAKVNGRAVKRRIESAKKPMGVDRIPVTGGDFIIVRERRYCVRFTALVRRYVALDFSRMYHLQRKDAVGTVKLTIEIYSVRDAAKIKFPARFDADWHKVVDQTVERICDCLASK